MMKAPIKTFVFFAPRLLLCAGLSISVSTAEPDTAGETVKPDARKADAPAGVAEKKSMEGKDRFKAFKKADGDDDRKLTFAEFSSMERLASLDEDKRRKLFDFLDRDQDGFLHMREARAREPRWMGTAQKEFGRLDVDGDGALDVTEFAELLKLLEKKKLPVLFEKLDRNKNDKIERDELKLRPHHSMRPEIDFAKHDVNASGGLDYQEYSAMPWMLKWPEYRRKAFFDKLDADSDGEITEAEIKGAHEKRASRGFKPRRPQREHGPREGKPPHRQAD